MEEGGGVGRWAFLAPGELPWLVQTDWKLPPPPPLPLLPYPPVMLILLRAIMNEMSG